MPRKINPFPLTGIAFVCLLLFTQCNGQSAQPADCKLEYSRATKSLNNYYANKDEAQLAVALKEIDSALQCGGMNPRAVQLKITVLLLSKKYQEGYDFVKPLDAAVFPRPYQKMMNENWFMAHVFEGSGDTIARDSLYRKIVLGIGDYIESENVASKPFDEMAYYDLYFVEGQFQRTKALEELGGLEKKFPAEKDFFAGLRDMIDNKDSELSAQPRAQ
jgi:hypothetical protein